MDRYIPLTAREAALGNKLGAIVRVVEEPVVSKWDDGKRRVFCFPEDAAEINELLKSRQAHPNRRVVTPFGAPGDVLHGKETWAEIRDLLGWDKPHGAPPDGYGAIAYCVDGEIRQHGVTLKDPERFSVNSMPRKDEINWRSPVTMPRWAIRRHYRVLTSRACMASELYDDCNFSFEYAEHMLERGIKDNQWVWYCELA